MAFVQQTLRPFSRHSIESLNPNQFGVYGIYNASRCIYVGKGDIRQRLLDHLNGDNPCILRSGPSSWTAELVNGEAARDRREIELIAELNPSCNKRLG